MMCVDTALVLGALHGIPRTPITYGKGLYDVLNAQVGINWVVALPVKSPAIERFWNQFGILERTSWHAGRGEALLVNLQDDIISMYFLPEWSNSSWIWVNGPKPRNPFTNL